MVRFFKIIPFLMLLPWFGCAQVEKEMKGIQEGFVKGVEETKKAFTPADSKPKQPAKAAEAPAKPPDWMRKAGCLQISYGVESGSERIRQHLNKASFENRGRSQGLFSDPTLRDPGPGLLHLRRPGETEETIRGTIDICGRSSPLGRRSSYLLDLFPGTALYDQLIKETRITDEIWLNRIEGVLHYETDPRLSEEKILEFGRRFRTTFFENVHSYAGEMEPIDRNDPYRHHADFSPASGLTFSHISPKRTGSGKGGHGRGALSQIPHVRARSSRLSWGLGDPEAKGAGFRGVQSPSPRGASTYPDSRELTFCLGLNFLNPGVPRRPWPAWSVSRIRISLRYTARCRRALGGMACARSNENPCS